MSVLVYVYICLSKFYSIHIYSSLRKILRPQDINFIQIHVNVTQMTIKESLNLMLVQFSGKKLGHYWNYLIQLGCLLIFYKSLFVRQTIESACLISVWHQIKKNKSNFICLLWISTLRSWGLAEQTAVWKKITTTKQRLMKILMKCFCSL